jgi:cytochrome c oxidase cbb3-type subunit I/II
VGGKYANLWHYLHMMDPRSTSPGSNMPAYPWLKDRQVDLVQIANRMRTLVTLGVPYSEADLATAQEMALSQGQLIAADLAQQDVQLAPASELAAVIAYLQRLGRGPQPGDAEEPQVSRARPPEGKGGTNNQPAAAPTELVQEAP